MTRTGKRPISVPMHKVVKRGLLRAIIKQAGLTVERFVELL
jgi:predicted RNA binding protein YcfA (HicA-like mRNA interferase family)